jgi:LDH2 family malate/lactate/ureidoglycolate dehydrogenase
MDDGSPPCVIPEHALRDFTSRVLIAAGTSGADAEIVTDALIWADLRARHPQGVLRLPTFIRRITRGLIRSPAAMSWTRVAPALHQLDAANGFGQVAGRVAMERSVELARVHGIGGAAVRRSNHYGAASYYCAHGSAAGFLAFAFTNAFPKVAPFGGIRPVLGTNPLAFGCPTRSGVPILIDLSTGAMSGSSARERLERAAPLPAGAALDEQGHPTTDPTAVSRGCLLPAAGPKGFAHGLMVENLSGVFTGAAMGPEIESIFSDRPTDTGHFFIAIDIARFQPLDVFVNRLETLLDRIKESTRMDGVEEIRFPGEIRGRFANMYAKDGIPLQPETVAVLRNLGHEFRVPWPDCLVPTRPSTCPH